MKNYISLSFLILAVLASGCTKQINQDLFPVVSLAEVDYSNGTLTCKGQVSSKSDVTRRGFCIGCDNNTEPIAHGWGHKYILKADGVGTGEFSASVTLSETSNIILYNMFNNYPTLYIRAYAVNKAGISYSEVKTFSLPTSLTTPTVSNITKTSATVTSKVSGGEVTSRGFCYSSTNPYPNMTNSNCTTVTCGSSTGTFYRTLSGLTRHTTYYVRAFAKNANNEVIYSSVKAFTTASN